MKSWFVFVLLIVLLVPASAQSSLTPMERIDSLSNEIASSSWSLSGVLLSKGLSLRVRGLPFSEEGSAFTSEQVPLLDSLADFLRLNPSIKLQISVHYSEDTQAAIIKQSRSQAKAIASYLLARKVNSKRLQIAAGGTSNPLYPENLLKEIQSTQLQAQYRTLNTRVEFEILANLN